jgi:hypothetical protein
MIGSRGDHSDIDPVTLIPASIAIDDIDPVSSVEIVDSTFTVYFPDLRWKEVSILILSNALEPPQLWNLSDLGAYDWSFSPSIALAETFRSNRNGCVIVLAPDAICGVFFFR